MQRTPPHGPRILMTGLLTSLLSAALGGCALSIEQSAPADRTSDDVQTVITGRMNYVIDGRMMTPYGGFRPAWPAPFLQAVNLESGDTHAFPAVEAQEGRFRWLATPGAYMVGRIGFGTYFDDTYIAWPRVVLCVPRAPGRTVYVGHLRLEGTRYDQEVRLSTGTTYRSKGVRYTFKVEDEAADAPDALRRLMRVAPEMPIGDGLQAQWKADRAGLMRRACGTADAAS